MQHVKGEDPKTEERKSRESASFVTSLLAQLGRIVCFIDVPRLPKDQDQGSRDVAQEDRRSSIVAAGAGVHRE